MAKIVEPKALDINAPIPLSFSSMQLFNHGCERKYQLYKILNYAPLTAREDTIHTLFGKAVGVAVPILCKDPDAIDEAMHAAFMEWRTDMMWEHINAKSIVTCLQAVKEFAVEAKLLKSQGWEIATLDGGKPATEISFKLTVKGLGYYIGYIDLILYNEALQSYRVIEVKTMQGDYDSDQWQHRMQDVGYLFVGALTGVYQNTTQYPTYVCKVGERFWNMPLYSRTEEDFKHFLYVLTTTLYRIKLNKLNGVFPRSGNCTTYGQLCPAFADCQQDIQYTPDIHNEDKEWDIEVTIDPYDIIHKL